MARIHASSTPRPRALEVWTYEIPMRIRFEHARAARDTSTGILVRLVLDDGSVGWGEGIPRDYVTGETVAGAVRVIRDDYADRLAADAPLGIEPIADGDVVHNAA